MLWMSCRDPLVCHGNQDVTMRFCVVKLLCRAGFVWSCERVAIAKIDQKKRVGVHFQPQHVVFVTKPPVQDVMQLRARSTCVALSMAVVVTLSGTSFQLSLSVCHLPGTSPQSRDFWASVSCCIPRSSTLRLVLIVRVSHCCVRCT